jgi:LysM repeat protein
MNRQLLLLLLLLNTVVIAQPHVKRDTGRVTPEMYIELFKDAAVADMLKMGVPASITLAQGMYESDYGNSPLAKSANNHFGIKCHKDWNGDTYHQDDDAPNECFRRYEHVMESYDDHSSFLRNRERYHFLFNLDITDYKGWAHGLKKAGYATNPAYASRLIAIIERYKLYEHDAQGVKMPVSAGEMKEQVGTTRPNSTRTEQEEQRKETVNSDGQATPAREHRPVRSVSASPAVSANTVNGVTFVTVKKGDTWTKIARENNIELWQILEYNDAAKNDILKENERIFIQPKKNKSETFTHTVQEGETMRSVSQQYAVKLSRLYRMNEMEFGKEPKPGDQLFLKRAMLLGVVL